MRRMPNKQCVMKLLGCNGGLVTEKHWFPHPLVGDNKVYFLIDVPHLYKCVRNQIFNRKDVQFKGMPIHYSHFVLLYEEDTRLKGQLRLVPSLTDAHIFPTNFQKMSVKLATQLFSNRVANAFKIFRGSKDAKTAAKFSGTAPTQEFVQLMNDSFDVLNARCSPDGITRNNWDGKKAILNELLNALKETEFPEKTTTCTEAFCSMTTLHALRMTVNSTIAIVDKLHSENYKYVLTGKLNQDCVERFFGIVRSAGGGQDKPTAHSFLHIYRMLSVYYPTRVQLRNGNVILAERMQLLTTYKNCMIKGMKDNKKAAQQLREDLKDKLMKGLCYSAVLKNLGENVSLEDQIVFDLCGYLIHTRKRLLKCEKCKCTLQAENNRLNIDYAAAELVSLRTRGGLRFVTPEMHQNFVKVENVIALNFDDGLLYAHDAFDKIISKISHLNFVPMGCDDHREKLVPKLILEYCIIRCRFQAKRMRVAGKLKQLSTKSHAFTKKGKL